MLIQLFLFAPVSFAQEFSEGSLQIGSSFGRKFLKPGEEDSLAQQLKRAARSAGEFGTGSAFYIGQFNGRHLIGTNAHVAMAFAEETNWSLKNYEQNPEEACAIFPGYDESDINYVRFSLVEKNFNCERLVGIWAEIDFAIFEIKNPEGFDFEGMGLSLVNSVEPYKNQSLAMFSYGQHLNDHGPDLDLAYSTDRHCRSFSDAVDHTLIVGEEIGDRGVWSFALGCDISVGDSGSALIDKASGLFAGVIWAGAQIKGDKVKNDSRLSQILESEIEDKDLIWSEMNYGVPASKVVEVIQSSLKNKSSEDQKTLRAVLGLDLTL